MSAGAQRRAVSAAAVPSCAILGASMDSVFLISRALIDDEIAQHLSANARVLDAACLFAVDAGGSRIYVERFGELTLAEGFSPMLIALVTAFAERPVVRELRYRDIRALRPALLPIVDRDDLLVDCDEGVVMSGRDFAARLRHDPDWDWRGADLFVECTDAHS